MAQEVRDVEDEIGEHQQEHQHAEGVLDGRIGREGKRVGLRLHLDAGRVGLADHMQRPDVQNDHAGNHERQQVVQREEAVQRRIVTAKPPRSNCWIQSPTSGIAVKKPVMTVAPQKLICPHGST